MIFNILEGLTSKVGVKLQDYIGEDLLAKINEVELDETKATELKDKLKGLMNKTEAETNPDIHTLKKDQWHKEARKSLNDQYDLVSKEQEELLNDTEKDEYNALETSVKKTKFLFSKLKDKIKNADTDAEKKAIKKEYDDLKLKIDADYLPKSSLLDKDKEINDLRKQLKSFETSYVKDHIVRLASTQKIAENYRNELLDDIVLGAVNKYIESESFGDSKISAKISYNKETNRVEVKNKADETLAISVNGNILTTEELVKGALQKYKILDEGQQQQQQQYKSNGDAEKKKPTIGFNDARVF
jgi:hypothetical protein